MMDTIGKTIRYMAEGRGNIPVRIYYALGSYPLQFRTFGDNPTGISLSDEAISKIFPGSYLITMISSAIVNKYTHAHGTLQTFYADKYILSYLKKHGLTDCGLWDIIDNETLDAGLNTTNHDSRWAYSASKPFATLKESERSKESREKLPILFHDTDLVMRHAYDKILGLRNPDDIVMAFGHLEAVGRTEFYPDFKYIHLPDMFRLDDEGMLVHIPTGRHYKTTLPAVNTCLMYFSDMSFAEEWGVLFRDMIMSNFPDDYTWIKGEQDLLACDQRTALMVSDRRDLTFGNDIASFLPLSWSGKCFTDIMFDEPPSVEWHYYRPEYLDPEEFSYAAKWTQDIQHLWIEKKNIELHGAYSNYMGVFGIELIRRLCPMVKISWPKIEESLRSFECLKSYFAIADMNKPLDELLLEEKAKPAEQRIVDNVLIRDLREPMIPKPLRS